MNIDSRELQHVQQATAPQDAPRLDMYATSGTKTALSTRPWKPVRPAAVA